MKSQGARDRQAGSLLFEIILALTILTVGVLGYLGSFFSNHRAVRTMHEMDAASAALQSVAERLRAMPLEDVYANYHGRGIAAPGLEGPDGGTATVDVTCYTNEAQIPVEFGPVEDLDGRPGSAADASTSYRLLPVHLRVVYGTAHGPATEEIYVILGPD